MEISVPLFSFIKKQKWMIPLFFAGVAYFLTYSAAFIGVYAQYFYPKYDFLLRSLLGWMPFSVGDLIYLALFFWLGYYLIIFIGRCFQKKITVTNIFSFLKNKCLPFFCWGYVFFQISWGFNYAAQPIKTHFSIEKSNYTINDLKELNCLLLSKINAIRPMLPPTSTPPVFQQINWVEAAYQLSAQSDSFLHYYPHDTKPSLLSFAAHYIDFMGYFNPFTHEAQVVNDLPLSLSPYIIAHEIAHQLGCADESEASFVGYFVCTKSSNLYLQYSAYLEAYFTVIKELGQYQSTAVYRLELHPLIKEDIKNIRLYFTKNDNAIAPFFSSLYHQYLLLNRQKAGIKSYDALISWLISYYQIKA